MITLLAFNFQIISYYFEAHDNYETGFLTGESRSAFIRLTVHVSNFYTKILQFRQDIMQFMLATLKFMYEMLLIILIEIEI